jgi:hypothetical protein
MTEVVDNNMFTHIVGWREIERRKRKEEETADEPSFNDVLVREAVETNYAATWPYSRTGPPHNILLHLIHSIPSY